MNDKTLQMLELAAASAAALAKLIAELKQQAGMTDEEMLAWADTKDAQTRDYIRRFLAQLKSEPNA